jgi:hypothetical protein
MLLVVVQFALTFEDRLAMDALEGTLQVIAAFLLMILQVVLATVRSITRWAWIGRFILRLVG